MSRCSPYAKASGTCLSPVPGKSIHATKTSNLRAQVGAFVASCRAAQVHEYLAVHLPQAQ